MPKNVHTRTHTAQPLAPMLENSFSTALENRFAELNNQLAREGRLTNDPMVLALRGIRRSLAEDHGVTFERVPVKGAVVAPAPVAAPKATAAKATKTAAAPKASKVTTTAAAPTTGKARKALKIKEEQIASLQVAGSVSEASPYGCDADGRPLAPYGIKNDGTPMRRRGRVAAAPTESAASETPAASAAPASEADLDDLLKDL
jgi:hypothetical protein